MFDEFAKRIFVDVLTGFKKAVNLIFSSVVMIITVMAFALVLHFVPFWLVLIVLIGLLGAHVYHVYLEVLGDDDV